MRCAEIPGLKKISLEEIFILSIVSFFQILNEFVLLVFIFSDIFLSISAFRFLLSLEESNSIGICFVNSSNVFIQFFNCIYKICLQISLCLMLYNSDYKIVLIYLTL